MNRWNSLRDQILGSPRLPWVLLGFALLILLVQSLWRSTTSPELSQLTQTSAWILALIGLGIFIYLAQRLFLLQNERRILEDRLASSNDRVDESFRRMELLFRVSQKFMDAEDENQVIEPMLQLIVELSHARGASFVPIDEHGQAQTALSYGELPVSVLDAWLEYLMTEGVRRRCRDCDVREPIRLPDDCPLLRGPFGDAQGLVCLAVRRGEREFGVLNIFLPNPGGLDARTRVLLGALLDEAAMGLEGVYLRRRELSALRQLQFLRQKSDLTALLNGLLGNVSQTLDADFAVMIVPPNSLDTQPIHLIEGQLPPQAGPFLDGLLQGVVASGKPVLLNDLAGNPDDSADVRTYVKSLAAAPLISPEHGVLGAILVGHQKARGFLPRQLALLQTIAGQVALVVQNASLIAELEYQTMLQERARLAREIHDGLAQTIGFLKLQAGQLRNHLAKNDLDRATSIAETVYISLSEAYQDARLAIDELRISPDECGLPGWLSQIASEFQDLSGIIVNVEMSDVQTNLSAEIQAQLIRIVQEALNNVRKHAGADSVQIICFETSGDLVLDVRDNGQGFSPQDVTNSSQHGLRGMRERAELIGADFQVTSRPHDGTLVRVRLPLKPVGEVR